LKNEYEAINSKLTSELNSLQNKLSSTVAMHNDVQRQLSDERTERHRREERFVLDKDQITREHESDIRKEKENAERRIMEENEKNNMEIRAIKQEHAEIRKRMEERLKELQHNYSLLETKYRNRESRQEDVEEINRLRTEMIEKDELVTKTREEMLYFKREMLNREESYNQKFNAKPNVGVMQVLKSKDVPPASGKPASNKPTHVLNPRGGASMGLDLGMNMGATNTPMQMSSSSKSINMKRL
jgi:membrane-associated HD superfamily phosphohydrolase